MRHTVNSMTQSCRLAAQFYIELVYKKHLTTYILLFGSFGPPRKVFFHGQNNYKIRVSVLCSVCTKTLINLKGRKISILVENKLKLRFLDVSGKGRVAL